MNDSISIRDLAELLRRRPGALLIGLDGASELMGCCNGLGIMQKIMGTKGVDFRPREITARWAEWGDKIDLLQGCFQSTRTPHPIMPKALAALEFLLRQKRLSLVVATDPLQFLNRAISRGAIGDPLVDRIDFVPGDARYVELMLARKTPAFIDAGEYLIDHLTVTRFGVTGESFKSRKDLLCEFAQKCSCTCTLCWGWSVHNVKLKEVWDDQERHTVVLLDQESDNSKFDAGAAHVVKSDGCDSEHAAAKAIIALAQQFDFDAGQDDRLPGDPRGGPVGPGGAKRGRGGKGGAAGDGAKEGEVVVGVPPATAGMMRAPARVNLLWDHVDGVFHDLTHDSLHKTLVVRGVDGVEVRRRCADVLERHVHGYRPTIIRTSCSSAQVLLDHLRLGASSDHPWLAIAMVENMLDLANVVQAYTALEGSQGRCIALMPVGCSDELARNPDFARNVQTWRVADCVSVKPMRAWLNSLSLREPWWRWSETGLIGDSLAEQVVKALGPLADNDLERSADDVHACLDHWVAGVEHGFSDVLESEAQAATPPPPPDKWLPLLHDLVAAAQASRVAEGELDFALTVKPRPPEIHAGEREDFEMTRPKKK